MKFADIVEGLQNLRENQGKVVLVRCRSLYGGTCTKNTRSQKSITRNVQKKPGPNRTKVLAE